MKEIDRLNAFLVVMRQYTFQSCPTLHKNGQFSMTEMSCDRGEMETLYFKAVIISLTTTVFRGNLLILFLFSFFFC